jgi:membrane fusion protein (multidrug efflux system)
LHPRSWLITLTLALTAACGGADDKGGRDRAAPVGYVVVQPGNVPLEAKLDGRVVASETSEVRPQVSGIIRARNFVEGGYVRQGQPLYQIDPSIYGAAVDQANANLASARATADAAQAKANRYRPLAEIEAVSKQEYTDAAAQARQARAAVAQNQAALRTAQINMRFTTIPAPISGRIGRSLATVGALATANQADPLAVIQKTDPVYVDIRESAADLVALRSQMQGGNLPGGSSAVSLTLDDGSAYGPTGTLQFSEVVVDEGTGTVTLRARFPNPQGLLLPGMFVTAHYIQGTEQGVFLVPQQALVRDLGGKSAVFVVGPGNKAVRRIVDATRTVGTNWVVKSGLKPGDKVITQGLANLKTGAPIKPVPASAAEKLVPRPAGSGGAGGGAGGGGAKR